MVRPVIYSPKKAFVLSDAEKAKYQAIAAEVKKGAADAKASAKKIEAALASCAKDNAEETYADDVPAAELAYVVGGVEDVKTDDVTFEEPKVIVTQEEEEEGEERSLWGDGEDEPGAEE